ncbi:hypothetical protein HPB51_023362 [Rhipicephalus microplus]|uniref:Wd40 domain protein n=1 Tax=Rhipicephalus microplus TaxID=6941 RepID=A0A9J6DCS3_RHIMP|nr:hypothetical protein HPB51_023362 [Rhipicephalus microplus]
MDRSFYQPVKANEWGLKDHKVHVYILKCHSITEKKVLDHSGAITDVRYSPDGQYLAASDANRMVRLYLSSSYELAHKLDWCFHTARVNCIGWSPDSKFLATGSLDTGVIVWSTEHPTKHINIKNASTMLAFKCKKAVPHEEESPADADIETVFSQVVPSAPFTLQDYKLIDENVRTFHEETVEEMIAKVHDEDQSFSNECDDNTASEVVPPDRSVKEAVELSQRYFEHEACP